MKKVMLFFILIIMIFPMHVKAEHVYDIDIKININEDGSANIVEKWSINSFGSSWKKTIKYLDNFYVYFNSMYKNNERLNYMNYGWYTFLYGNNEYGSRFYNKKKKLNIYFGSSGFKKRTYYLNYTIDDYIYNIDSGQVLYWNLLNNVSADKIRIEISSYFEIDENIDLSLYGYDGNIYIEDGKIYIDSINKLKNDYVVLLVKFPGDSFNTSSMISGYSKIDDYIEHADLKLYEDGILFKDVVGLIILIIMILFLLKILIRTVIRKISKKIKYSYGYIDNKIIDKDNVLMFRDIPFNGDIYYAYVLFKINRIDYKDIDIISAIVLKWIHNKNIKVVTIDNVRMFDLTNNNIFDNEYDEKLFSMMLEASNNGILEIKEFYDWAKHYDMKFLALFAKIEEDIINNLKKEMRIYHRITKDECKYKYVMDNKIYDDSIKLYGFKKFLEEFSCMDMREIMELHLWEEYLIFAALFGMADTISIQLKELYPDVEKIDIYDLI